MVRIASARAIAAAGRHVAVAAATRLDAAVGTAAWLDVATRRGREQAATNLFERAGFQPGMQQSIHQRRGDMSMFKRITIAALALLFAANVALAGSSTITVTPGTGATYAVGTNGSSNFYGMFGICDGAACANMAGVSSTGALAVGPIQWAGGTLGAMANYGTSPGAVLVPGVNADVTNVNANGSATSANSSPVVIASDQAPVHSSAPRSVRLSEEINRLLQHPALGREFYHCHCR